MDVLGLLLGAGMTEAELRDELLTMLLAGHETTSASLAWAFERLARHPGAWASDDAAIAQETLRTRPVLWLAGRTLLRDLPVGDVGLPAGTLAYACSYLAHTRASEWPDRTASTRVGSPNAPARSPVSRSAAAAGVASAPRSRRWSWRR